MENSVEKSNNSNLKEEQFDKQNYSEVFKKPILIGKIGALPRKLQPVTKSEVIEKEVNFGQCNSTANEAVESDKQSVVALPHNTENVSPFPYKEPGWSGLPESMEDDYILEVLKTGTIIETINLMQRQFWIFGRLANCNIFMQHPTISRHHAVLQYRKLSSENESSGFYIYDLGSTHGTFLNKNRLKPRVYVKVQVGHILKFGCSTRSYILNGPKYDAEEESELTVTELKKKRAEELQKREEQALEAKAKAEKEREERLKKEEERGVDWGLGEDADSEEDISENPYAQTYNEELYIDDPKKTLRGFFEREGLDLEYDCSEQGMGQFLCKVELPLDDEMGRPIIAEVLHRGKKKEAVVQCALEACRILDRYGVLRQAVHETRKRKSRNWEENDYYDSDDDTFLDRTGTVEKKREMRMKSKVPQKGETYESLLEKEKIITSSIVDLESQLASAQAKLTSAQNVTSEEDSLDVFMKELKHSKPDKQTVNKIKLELTKLRKEHENTVKLINIARPADLPPLISQVCPSTSKETKKQFPIIGKRKKTKVQLPAVHSQPVTVKVDEDEVEEYEESDDERNDKPEEEVQNVIIPETTNLEEETIDTEHLNNEVVASSNSSDEGEETTSSESLEKFRPLKSLHETMTFMKFENILKKGLPPFADKHQEKLEKILNSLKKLAANEDRMHVDWKILSAKKRKVMKLISDLRTCEPNEKLEHKVSSELNRILNELNSMTEQKYKVIGKVKKMGNEIKNISHAINKDFNDFNKEVALHLDDNCAAGCSSVINEEHICEKMDASVNGEGSDERKKRKNQRRIQQRQEKAEIARQRGYEEDTTREDYNMWVPPADQSGDGRTSLNDKYGY